MPGDATWTIRDAVPDDAEAIVRMHKKSWLDTYPNDEAGVSREWVEKNTSDWSRPERLESRRNRIREALISPDMIYKIALNPKGEIVGFACPFRDGTEQRVGGLYVEKSYQGTGLAQSLMNEMIDWSDPTRPLVLEVAAYNERAKRFYKKYGFEEVPDSGQLHKSTIPTITMIRKGSQQ